MRAGTLKHKIVIERPESQVTDTGDYTTVWNTILETFADVRYVSAKADVIATTKQVSVATVFRIRFRPGFIISDIDRIQYRGDTYKIIGNLPSSSRKYLEIFTTVELDEVV